MNDMRRDFTNRHLVATIKCSSSEEGPDEGNTYNVRKKLRKRRRQAQMLTPKAQRPNIEAISDADSDEVVGMHDSDYSESMPSSSAMLGHMHGDGPFINTMNDNHLMDLLSGGENDGSYSSPMSQKSGKNMADFDDDDSPCEEELAQLAMHPQFDRPRNMNMNEHFRGNNMSGSRSKQPKIGPAPKPVENSNKSGGGLHSSSTLNLSEISQPANVLLWDLLMDDKIVSSPKSFIIRRQSFFPHTFFVYSRAI